MYTYAIRSGRMYKNGHLASSICYSGKGQFKNDFTATDRHNEGPIPCGRFKMKLAVNSDEHGPRTIALEPYTSNEMYGRMGFLMHGDSIKNPGTASLGCIVAPRWLRDEIDTGADKDLLVVKEDSDVAMG